MGLNVCVRARVPSRASSPTTPPPTHTRAVPVSAWLVGLRKCLRPRPYACTVCVAAREATPPPLLPQRPARVCLCVCVRVYPSPTTPPPSHMHAHARTHTHTHTDTHTQTHTRTRAQCRCLRGWCSSGCTPQRPARARLCVCLCACARMRRCPCACAAANQTDALNFAIHGNSGKAHIEVGSVECLVDTAAYTSSASDGSWHHVAALFNAGSAYVGFAVDGAVLASAECGGVVASATGVCTCVFVVCASSPLFGASRRQVCACGCGPRALSPSCRERAGAESRCELHASWSRRRLCPESQPLTRASAGNGGPAAPLDCALAVSRPHSHRPSCSRPVHPPPPPPPPPHLSIRAVQGWWALP